MSNISQQVCDAIEILLNKAISQAPYDKTVQGIIEACVDEANGKYKVRYQDSSFYAYSDDIEHTYSKNTSVYVLIPGNDLSKDKRILGTAKKLGSDYIAVKTNENLYAEVGNNILINQKAERISLCSYKDSLITLYDSEKLKNEQYLSINNEVIKYYLKEGYVKCGGVFETSLPAEQQYQGNYGLIFELIFKDNSSSNLISRTLIVDVNKMIGTPYKLVNPTHQIGIFEIDADNFIKINKIQAFVNNFPVKTTDNKPDDIFINEIELFGLKLIEDNSNGHKINFKTPNGIAFYSGGPDELTVETALRANGKLVNQSDYACYWFSKNNSITMQSPYYNSKGGQGWRCLNDFNDLGEGAIEWLPSVNIWKIKKSEVLAKELEFKCVVVYNNTEVSSTFTIVNFESEYDISIISNKGFDFSYDIGYPTLTCLVNGEKNTGYTYVWSKVDNTSTFESLPETIEKNKEYNTAISDLRRLENALKNETVFPVSTQARLDEIKAILKKYETITRVEKDRIYNIKISEITSYCWYQCSVFNNNTYLGETSIKLTNSLKSEKINSLLLENANILYKYNAHGIAPTSLSNDSPLSIKAITFKLYDDKGEEIPQEAIEEENIEWIVPINETLLKIDVETDIVDEEAGTKTYKGLKSLVYTLESVYKDNYKNNTIILKINYQNKNYIATTNFSFAKEGQNGTNGTDFVCKIIPNVKSGKVPFWPVMTGNNWNFTPKDAAKPFNIVLYHNGLQIFNNAITGNSEEGKEVIVKWSILKNKNDISAFEIDAKTNELSYKGFKESEKIDNKDIFVANLLKAEVKYNGERYISVLPLVTINITDNNYQLQLKDDSGFQSIAYSTDGKDPSYVDEKFELIINKKINGVFEDVSKATKEHAITYNWIFIGQTKQGKDIVERNQLDVQPKSTYEDGSVTSALVCDIGVAKIHIPIYTYINTYGMSAINEWDGQSYSLNNNETVLLVPQVGAGKKNDNNQFTGILMGTVKEGNNTKVGLLGYSNGQQSIFLDANSGKSIFGIADGSQIIIDPSGNKAEIRSGNYKTSGEEKGGLLIDFKTPKINFGSGNFNVDSDGVITATNANLTGEINAKSGTIGSGSTKIKIGTSTKIDDEGNSKTYSAIYSGNHSTLESTKNGFYIGTDGLSIGSNFNISNKGVLTATEGNFKGSITSNDATITGGSLTVGDNFKVTSNGTLTASSGTIGGWTIGEDTLNAGNVTFSSSGALSGRKWNITADGEAEFNNIKVTGGNISYGKININEEGKLIASNVNVSGSITATSGTIGGCSIEDGVLKVKNANITNLTVNKIIDASGTSSNNTTWRSINSPTGAYFQGGQLGVKTLNFYDTNGNEVSVSVLTAIEVPKIKIKCDTLSVLRGSIVSNVDIVSPTPELS